MHLLFIDESGTPPPVNAPEKSPFFVLGGVVVPDESWHGLKEKLEEVKREFDVQGEIKWRSFFWIEGKKKKEGALAHLDREKRELLRSRLFDILATQESITTICVVVDTAAAYMQPDINNPNELYERAYKIITERFQYHLQGISDAAGTKINGLVVCDNRNAHKDDSRLREFHDTLLSGSHKTYAKYKNLVEGLFIAPSHLSVGIQFADMVAGAVLRNIDKNDHQFFDRISHTLRKSKEGKVEGFGLVWIPTRK